MLSRYLRQVLGKDTRKIKKIILTVRNEKNDYFMIDLTDEERGKNANSGIAPLDVKNTHDLSRTIISDICSPISPNIYQNKNIFIDEPEFSHCISPQNYSIFINSNKSNTKEKY